MNADEKRTLCKEIGAFNNLCSSLCERKKGCVDCKIKQFKNKYNVRINNCKVIFIAAELLGYNESTAKFIEDQYWDEKNKICSKINCSECYIYDIEHFSPITLSCLEIYIAINLLKDV